MIGNWNTFDYQIGYNFGRAEELTPETFLPGYAKGGEKLLSEKAVSPSQRQRKFWLEEIPSEHKICFWSKQCFRRCAAIR